MYLSMFIPFLFFHSYSFIPIPLRLYGYESEAEVTFKRIKAPLYGKCVSVSGTVLRVSSVKPLVTQLAFKCALCQEINVSYFRYMYMYMMYCGIVHVHLKWVLYRDHYPLVCLTTSL